MWHHDVTNARTCLFTAVCLTIFAFEFRPRTFTIGFYGKIIWYSGREREREREGERERERLKEKDEDVR